jgi:ribonuclease HI
MAGVGVVLVSPQNHVLPRTFLLTEPCSNKVTEYNALLIGLELARDLGVRHLEAYGDSKLAVNQVREEVEVRNVDLIPHHEAAVQLADTFEGFYIDHVSRSKNTHADELAALAATLGQPAGTNQRITVASRQLF